MKGWGNGKNGKIVDLYVWVIEKMGMETDYEKLRGAFIEVNGKYKIKN